MVHAACSVFICCAKISGAMMLQAIKREILGEDEEDESEGDSDDDSEDESSDEEGAGGAPAGGATQKIQDNTETNLINLRRTIYLTIMSALDFEEAGHKLMKITLGPGQEVEITTMIIECCSQEKSYSKCAPCLQPVLLYSVLRNE
jgi:pre-mRNA-splicing factor CWC22